MLSRTALTMRQGDIVVYVGGESFHYRIPMLLDCSSSRISRVNSLMPRVRSRPAAEKAPAQGRVKRSRSQAEDRTPGRFRRAHRRRRNLCGFMGPLHLIPRV